MSSARGRLARIVLAIASLSMVFVAIGSLSIGTVAHAQDRCAIPGVASGITVTVRAEGERGYRRVRLEQPTRVEITPMRSGITGVRVLDGDAAVDGTTGADFQVVLARAISLRGGAVELPAGLPIERLRPAPGGPWVEIDAAIGDDLFLRGAAVPCSELAILSGEPSITALTAIDARGPSWRARTTRLALFDVRDGDESIRIDVAPGAGARFVELSRRTPWVDVALRTSLGARLRGWVHDWDLVR